MLLVYLLARFTHTRFAFLFLTNFIRCNLMFDNEWGAKIAWYIPHKWIRYSMVWQAKNHFFSTLTLSTRIIKYRQSIIISISSRSNTLISINIISSICKWMKLSFTWNYMLLLVFFFFLFFFSFSLTLTSANFSLFSSFYFRCTFFFFIVPCSVESIIA